MKRAFGVIFAFVLSVGLCKEACADSTVVFNEVQYHPVGDETKLEWLELHNQMAVDMDISGWYLSDGVDFTFPTGTIVPGGGYLVIAASPSGLAAATSFAGALGPFTGRLDNSGERLELRNQSDRMMDELDYKDSGNWPAAADGSGFTLAKIDPDLGSGLSASWTVSAEPGGTPGALNFPIPDAPGSLPKSLISYWSLDQTSGSMLDTAGGNNGTVGSAASRVVGIVGVGAVSFNNTSNSFVSVGSGSSSSFSTTTGIGVEALIEPTWTAALNDHDEIFRKEDGNNRILLSFQNDGNTNGFSNPPVGDGPVLSFGLNVGGTYSELDMLLDGQAGRPLLADLVDGAPHHVAATYDSTSGIKAIYVDGAVAFSTNLGAGSLITSGGTTTAYIGNTSGRGEPYTGVIDEVAAWKRTLTAAEIAAHWTNAQAGKNYFETDAPQTVARPKLVLNEVSPTSGQAGWIEIFNPSAAAIDLKNFVVRAADVGREYIFPTRSIPAGGYVALTEAQLGFQILPGDVLFLFGPAKTAIFDGLQVDLAPRARFPDGSGRWLLPDHATQGTPNSFRLHDEIVINEIMYHHRGETDGVTFQESSEAWVEIFNRGSGSVDLSGWRFSSGVNFDFPQGTTLSAGEYLVVAYDKDQLKALYPAIRVLGNFTGSLSRKSDRIELVDAVGNPADEVRYRDSGRWPAYADGGGSSLELRDPDADNSRAEAWAASDESGKAAWQSYSYTVTAAANVGPTQWNEFVLGLLDAGEALIDNLHVIETPDTTPKELLQNSCFDNAMDKWRLLGNHRHSEAVEDAHDPAGGVLHLVATGATEHMHNHLETTLAGGARVTNSRKYQISFEAKWLAGSNQLNTRLYFNRCPKTTLLAVPALNGTPGARNSRSGNNIGPTCDGLAHSPVVPAASEAVTVSVTASDPDGVNALKVWYSVNAGAWASAAMSRGADGLWRGQIPGQAAAALVQFYVEATDSLGVVATLPSAGRDSRALYRVQDNLAVLGRVHNLRILMTAADTSFIHLDTNVMSNDRLGCTLIYDERTAFYDVGVRLKGSERGRNVSGRVGFNLKLDPEQRFRGVHGSIQVDRSGGWKFGGPFGQDEIVVKHVASHAGGVPCMYDDMIRVIAPRSAQTGPALLIMAAYGDVFLSSQFENGGDGQAFELELIYYPTSTADGKVDGLKRPEPDGVLGTDFTNLGNDKEPYRWTFLLENNRERDDYSGLIALSKAMAQSGAALQASTEAIMDLDEWMRAFVIYSLCGINDAYTRGNNHNLIVYQRPEDGRFLACPWDMDFSWVLATNAPLWGDQNLGRITQLSPNRRLFYCHLIDVIASTYNTDYMSRWTSHYGSLAGQDYSSILTFIGQRRTYVLSQIPAKVPFAITTNSGNDFSVDATTAVLEGNAWFDVKYILVEGATSPAKIEWTNVSKWKTTLALDAGVNELALVGLNAKGDVIASDTIRITSTVGSPAPHLDSVTPLTAMPGDLVTVKGTGFKAGLQVLFGATPSAAVNFDPGLDPGTLTARVPGLPDGAAAVTVKNSDGRTSNAINVTVRTSTVFVRGDVNLDSSVDLADVIRLLFHLYLGEPIACRDAGDANNNEVLDVADAIFTLNFLFRGGPRPSAPFPGPGADTGAAGVLDCGLGV